MQALKQAYNADMCDSLSASLPAEYRLFPDGDSVDCPLKKSGGSCIASATGLLNSNKHPER